MFEHFAIIIMLLFVSASAYASEIKSDGETTQQWKKKNKTVESGISLYSTPQEGGSGEHKQGAGYEYLQKGKFLI